MTGVVSEEAIGFKIVWRREREDGILEWSSGMAFTSREEAECTAMQIANPGEYKIAEVYDL